MNPDAMTTDSDLAAFRQRARELGLSNADLAARIGRHESYMRGMLTRHHPMARAMRAKLIEVLGLAS